MIDIERAVFLIVASEFQRIYPEGTYYDEEVSVPQKFPCLTFVEEDNYTYEASLEAEPGEHEAYLVYGVNVYSDKSEGAKQECKEMINLVDKQMQKLGFIRLSCNQIKNVDQQNYRISAKYRGVVSENGRVYHK